MRSFEEFREILDSVFKRDDVRGIWGAELDADIAWRLGYAFAHMLKSAHETPRIAVGRDMRAASPTMAAEIIKGIEAAGGVAEDLGMCGSETVYYATGARADRYQGGAMVTASHNPAEYGGVKFVESGARPLDTAQLEELKEQTARLYEAHIERPPSSVERVDMTDGFVAKLCEVAGISASEEAVDLTVVVEAGNGMGGETFRPVAERLEGLLPGIRCVFSNATPDGSFPVSIPNPLLDSYVDILRDRVRAENADLGVCFDGDADRAGFVDDAGGLIDASLVSTILFEMLAPMYPGRRYVMGNLNSSMRFTDFIKKHAQLGGGEREFVMTPVGHAKIKGLMRVPPYFEDGSKVLFGSEHSGHYFYPDFFYADSGMTTALFMIRKAREVKAAGKTLSDELDQWRRGYSASGEINETVETDDKAIAKIGEVAAEYLEDPKRVWRGIVEGAAAGTHEVRGFGASQSYDPAALEALDLRVDSAAGETPRWWFSVRKSGNEPKLRLNVESDDEAKMMALRDDLLGIIRA